MSTKSLKPDWKMVKFGDVVNNSNLVERDIKRAGIERIVGLEHLDPENLHIRRWNNAEEGTSFTRKFVLGQTLFGKRRAYQKKVAYAEFEGICSSDILTFEPKNQKVLLPELLPFICQTDAFFAHALDTSAGSLSPRTSWSALKDFEFPLPPLDEQKRIAKILWVADDTVEAWNAVAENLESTKNQILRNTFLPVVIENNLCKLRKLKDVATLQTGIAKGRKYVNGEEVVELPYLSVANVKDGYLDLNEVKNITILKTEVNRYMLQNGDVLLTEGGDFDKLGRGTVWKGHIDCCLHQNHIFCVRVNERVLMPEFLSYQTASPYGKSYFLKCAKKTSNLASINSTQVKDFPVILMPIEEQKRIIGVLKKIEAELANIINEKQLVQSIIKRYFASVVNGDDDNV